MGQFAQSLNALGRWLFDHLWQLSIELTILAAVVLVVIYLLRIKSPKVRHVFWLLVLAKPIVTLLIASPVSLYWYTRPEVTVPVPPSARAAIVQPMGTERPLVLTEMPAPVRDTGSERGTSAAALSRETTPATTAEPIEAYPPAAFAGFDRYGAFGLVWLIAAGLLGLRLVVGGAYVAFLRQTAHAQAGGPLSDIVAEAAEALAMRRRTRVGVTDVAHGPVLAGILRPSILLPRKLAEEISPEQMKLVIMHELAHVRRKDNLILLIQRLAEMFLFFHPAVWLCGWAMRREAEAACDDAVLEAQGGSVQYADGLTRVAEMRDSLTRRLLVNTFAAAESHLSHRVRRILDGRVGRMTLGLSIASVVVLIIIGCLGLPTASERKAGKEGNLMAKVRREDGKVWIEGVPNMRVGFLRDDWAVLVKGMHLVLTARGEKTSLNDLMAYSGDAFNLCHATRWELRTAHSVPTDTLTNIAEAYGYAAHWIPPRWFHELTALKIEERRRISEKFIEQVWQEVDAGRPVLFGGTHGVCGSWRVVAGYDRGE